MTYKYAPPSRNPADSDTLTGLLKLAFTKFLQKTDDMLPAKVISYNKATNLAKVQPIIMIISTANEQIPRAAVASIQVYQASAGGFILRFPVKAGDLGWIKASDRDISLFKQTMASAPPNTQRKHSFEDAIFYPQAAFDLVTIADADADSVVLQNYAGTCKIALSDTGITMTAPDSIILNTTTVTVNASTQVILNTPITTITGIFNVEDTGGGTAGTITGNIQLNGSMVATGDVTASGTSLHTHKHSGVTTGGGDTGGPV